MRRVVIAVASCALVLLPIGASATSAPTNGIDRRGNATVPANGPLVFDWYASTFVAPPARPDKYFSLEAEQPAVSPDGRRLAYVGAVRTSPTSSRCCELFVADIDGDRARQLTDETRYPGRQGASNPVWSPDGRQIVVEYDGLWIIDVRTGRVVRRLTNDDPDVYDWDQQPTWSPDGRLIAFHRTTLAGSRLLRIRPDGTGLRRLTENPDETYGYSADWSPDGRWLVVVADSNLALVSRDGDTVRQLTHLRWRASFSHPTWSPDGGKIAVARQKPIRPGQPSDGVGTLALYRASGGLIRWVEGPWTQDMDDFYWASIDWAPRRVSRAD